MDVTLAASVDEFFHEVVTEALTAVDLDASEPAGWYLVGLLGDFTRARLTDEPLGMKLARPATSAGERVRTLKLRCPVESSAPIPVAAAPPRFRCSREEGRPPRPPSRAGRRHHYLRRRRRRGPRRRCR